MQMWMRSAGRENLAGAAGKAPSIGKNTHNWCNFIAMFGV